MLPIALFLSLLLGPTNYDDLLPQTLPVVLKIKTFDPATNKIITIEEIDQMPLDAFIHQFGHIDQNTKNEYGEKGYVSIKIDLIPLEKKVEDQNRNLL